MSAIPKKELMRRLYIERRKAGLVKCTRWVTPEQMKLIDKLLKS